MPNQFCVRVGNNIKKFRKESEMTLKELGEKNWCYGGYCSKV